MPIKLRITSHLNSFNLERYANSTSLSKYIWNLKNNQLQYTLTWDIIRKAVSYKGGGGKKEGICNLCITEAKCIMQSSAILLNTKSEIFYNCPHRKRLKYDSFKS